MSRSPVRAAPNPLPASNAVSNTKPSRANAKADQRPGERAVEPGIWREPVPMKPRKRLFVTLLIVFAVWVGALLTMYFTMVRRPHPPRPLPVESPQATAPA